MPASSWRSEPLPRGWGAIRYAVLARDPVCRWGMLPGEEGPCGQDSTDADHIGLPGDHRPEALRGLCHPHHVGRSASQARAAKAARRSRRTRPGEKHPAYKEDPGAREDPGPEEDPSTEAGPAAREVPCVGKDALLHEDPALLHEDPAPGRMVALQGDGGQRNRKAQR